jgi:hypothetical protein
MKINKAELQLALEKVRPGLSNRGIIEQMSCFAFIDNRVVTYNDEISISHPVSGLDGVTGAIKAEALYEFLRKVKEEEMDLEWEDNQVLIKAGNARAGLVFEREVRLPFYEVGEITDWQDLPEGIIDAFQFCYPCCSKSMRNPVLTAVNVNGDLVEATDSYQVIQYKLSDKVPGKGFLIPATTVKVLIKYDVKEISLEDNWVHFRTEDGTVFSARIIEGTFLNISQFLNKGGTVFNFPDTMLDALLRANVFVKKNEVVGDIPIITINVRDGQMKLVTKNEYGWFEEVMGIDDMSVNLRFHMGIDFLINLITKLQTCVIGENTIKFSGDNWAHAVALRVEDAL